MTGVLLLFLLPHAAGARDSENFYNPGISSVNIDIDGVPNRIYSRGMIPFDFWESVKNVSIEVMVTNFIERKRILC